MAWLMTRGRERAFREKLIDLARLRNDVAVLDVGCGTGTLAIAAKRRLDSTGAVYGIDPSPEMISVAGKKAQKMAVEVVFEPGVAEELPFPDGRFDVVLSTLLLHHLPARTRHEAALEIRRVLKPGGHVLAVDFGGSERPKRGFLSHLHQRHGHVKPADLIALIEKAGFTVIENGAVGTRDLNFVLATVLAHRQENGGQHE